MTKPKVEGTFTIDGLLEGVIIAEEDYSHIQNFVTQAKKHNIIFYPSVDGSRFSLLPEQHPVKLPPDAVSAEMILCDLLNQLMANFTAAECSQWSSTLRSTEYDTGYEKQTLYGIGNDCKIQPITRSVKANTIAPARPLNPSEKAKIAVFSTIAILIIFGISLFFVPYKKLANRVVENVRPYKLEELEIQMPLFDEYFEITGRQVKSGKLILTCKPLPKFPRTYEQMNELWMIPDQNMASKLSIETLARKHLFCELYNKDAELYLRHESKIYWTIEERKENDENEKDPNEPNLIRDKTPEFYEVFKIIIPFDRKLTKLKITY